MSKAARGVLKWIGVGVAGLVLIIGFVGGWAAVRYAMQSRVVYAVSPVDLAGVRGDAVHGKYLALVGAGCAECHGDDLGGHVFVKDPVAGQMAAPNITPSGLRAWSDGEIARAIHHGVGRDGRGLRMMPASVLQYLSREDVADLVAYLRVAPSVDRPSPEFAPGVMLKTLWAFGKMPDLHSAMVVDHAAGFTRRVPEGPTRAFGAYLYKAHCSGCHRPDGRGGRVPGGPPDWPPAANLTEDGAGGWTRDGFVRTFRTGINPSGTAVRPPMGESMKKIGKQVREVELRALWEYLRTLKGAEL